MANLAVLQNFYPKGERALISSSSNFIRQQSDLNLNLF